MKSLSGILIVAICVYFTFLVSHEKAFSSSTEEASAKRQIAEVKKSLDSLKDEFSYIKLSSREREEVDSQIYTLNKRIETLRPKDEFEWVQSSEFIEASYVDLLRNLHTYKVIREPYDK